MSDPTQPTDPTRGGGTWCDAHQRWECTRHVKASRGGGRCHGPRIVGTDACRMHAGKRAELAKAQGAAVTAWSALAGGGDVTATDAVLGMLHMSWLRVHLYAGLLHQQVEQAQAEAGGGPDGGRDGVGHGAGLIGQTYSGVRDIGVFATGEAVRGLAQLEAAERDRCVRFARTAHDMGIAEQQVRLAEQQGALLANAVQQILDRLELSAEQQAMVPQVVPGVLRAIEGGAA